MAGITIVRSTQNLIFAHEVATATGAQVVEDGQWIKIENPGELVIDREIFDKALVNGRNREPAIVDRLWRNLILNRIGFLEKIDDSKIVISDSQPKSKVISFVLRFDSAEQKQGYTKAAEKLGFPSLNSFILETMKTYCQGVNEINLGGIDETLQD